jgi:hypothetical protein
MNNVQYLDHGLDMGSHEVRNMVVHTVQNSELTGLGETPGKLYYRIDDGKIVFFSDSAYKKLLTEDDVTSLIGGLTFKADVLLGFTANVDMSTLLTSATMQGITFNTGDRVILIGQWINEDNFKVDFIQPWFKSSGRVIDLCPACR